MTSGTSPFLWLRDDVKAEGEGRGVVVCTARSSSLSCSSVCFELFPSDHQRRHISNPLPSSLTRLLFIVY